MANESVTVTQSLDQVTVVSDGPIGLNAGGTILGALNVGVDGTGHDVKFFGDTAGKYMQWDQSADKLFVNGEIEVNGTATTFNSTVITIDDPIFTLGGQQRTDALDDSKDRGIEFFYHDGAQKTGFMGYDDSADAFTFLTSATNSNEVFSGTAASVQMGHLNFVEGSGGQIQFNGTEKINIGTNNIGLRKPIYGMVSTVDIGLSSNPFRDGYFSGAVTVGAGSAGSPSLTFSSDTDTGMYRSGADALAFSTGGTERVSIDSSGNVDIDGDLSIDGTHRIKLGTGISGLQRRSDANLELVVSDNSGQINLVTLGSAGGKAVNFKTHTSSAASATTVASVDESGNLSVAGNISGTASQNDQGIEFSASALTLRNGAGSGGETITLGSNGAVVNATSSSSFDFTVKSSTSASALHVESSNGNVGVGTASPAAGIHLKGDENNIRIQQSDAGSVFNGIEFATYDGTVVSSAKLNQSSGEFRHHNSSSYFPTFYSNNGEAMRIDTSGRVGIGTTSPASVLHIKDATNPPEIRLEDAAGGTQTGKIIFDQAGQNSLVLSTQFQSSSDENVIQFAPADNVAMTIRGGTSSNNGNVGIGTASPAHLLHVYSSGNGEIEVERASGAAILTQAQASLGRFGTSSNHNLQLMANNSGYVTVTTAGNVGLGTSAPTRELHLDSGDALTTFKISNSTSGATITDGFDIELSSTTARLNNREGNIELAVSNSNVATLSSDGLSLGDNLFFRCGDSADLTLSHDASNSYIANETGDLYIRNSANDKDIIFQSDDGSGGVTTYITLDGSAGFTKIQQRLRAEDSVNLELGTSGDMRMFHNGANSTFQNITGDIVIENTADDRDIILKSDDGSGGVTAYLTLDGSAEEVYFSQPARFADSKVIRVGDGSDLQIQHNGTNSIFENVTGDLIFTNYADDKDIIFKSDDGSGGVTAYLTLDGSVGYNVASKHVRFEDNIEARFGAGSDFRIYHDGNNNFVDGYNGHVYIRNTVDNHDIVLQTDDGSGGITEYFRVDGGTEQVVFSKALNYSTTLVNDSNYTTTRSDSVILFHSMSTYRYLTLASADCVAGRKIHVKNRDNSEYIYIQTEGSENIDGSSSIIGTQTARGSITLISDGSNWFILNKYST